MKHLVKISAIFLCCILFFGCGAAPAATEGTTEAPTTESTSPYPVPDKLIALTFDDGPNGDMELILDTLAEYDAKATFFVIGKKISGNEKYLTRAHEEGHEIGSHSFSHERMTEKTEAEILEEISKTQKAVADITGVEPVWYRAPFLAANGLTFSLIQMPHAGSSDCTFSDGTNESLAEHRKYMVLNNAYDGAIVLGHVNDITAGVLGEILHELKMQGFEMVTISEMFARKGVTPELGIQYEDVSTTPG